MNQPPILTIKMVPAGVDVVIEALSRMPYQQVAALINEIAGQAAYQKQQLEANAAAPAPAPATEPATPEGETQQ